MNEKTGNHLLSFIIYFCAFILMVEWLKPVIMLTDTGHLKLFSVFLLLSFSFYFLRLNWKIVIPIKVLCISWILIFIYADFSFWSMESVSYLVDMIRTNLMALMAQEWNDVTNPFRTLLFFILLWMTTYLLNYWIRVRKSLLLFFLLTVLFITILDTFSPYNGEKSIVVTLVAGFIVIGLLYVEKLWKEHNKQIKGKFLFAAIVSLVGLLVFSSTLAYALPKAGPSWPDPVPFFTGANAPSGEGEGNGRGKGGPQKVGYGENDEQLGGAFIGDKSPVFYATVPDQQYWKIETKDTYTSKGWVQSKTEAQISSYDKGETISTDIPPGQADKAEKATISMREEYSFVMQPYGLINLNTAEPATISLNATNQKMTTFLGGNTVPLQEYEIEFSEPYYSLKALRASTNAKLEELTSEFDRYLQLPNTLPDRVRELATSVSAREETLYEKAKLIERYFRLNGFSYEKTDVPVPKGNTDYVDQFLFETKLGYCDNFSTSMVVMLRSLGIPARWVKGFAAGEIVDRNNDTRVYEVTNNNAHSWVEAYIPGSGWMQFEPTIGFTSGINLDYDLDIETEGINTPTPIVPKAPIKEETKQERAEISKVFTDVTSGSLKWISTHKATFFWSIIWLSFASLIIYYFRRKWMSKILIPMYRMKKNNWEAFEKMYHQLLKQLSLHGVKREQGETLTDYAKRIDSYFGGNYMNRLTNAYEKGFYGGNKEEINYASMRENWEKLINQLSG
ncbi:transglutaminase domain-containing protein [Psychrobacillus sp.]|uniref:DUF4129 domain-containing transglutaminase family protein n=1 Tax=Psychrobacillus sp. TaxID=1871623 RepID=UPI0028BECA91|nr:transglutaminase domain-containing protein [Psychrobacillus sp.]